MMNLERRVSFVEKAIQCLRCSQNGGNFNGIKPTFTTLTISDIGGTSSSTPEEIQQLLSTYISNNPLTIGKDEIRYIKIDGNTYVIQNKLPGIISIVQPEDIIKIGGGGSEIDTLQSVANRGNLLTNTDIEFSNTTYPTVKIGYDETLYNLYFNRGIPQTASGTFNIFIGTNIGENLTTGSYNLSIGSGSLNKITTGSYNMSFGVGSLSELTTGSYNTSNGLYALRFLTTGGYNSSFGTYSGYNSTTGSYNVFMGYQSGQANVGGSNNTYIGYQAGASLKEGQDNIMIGKWAGARFGASTSGVYGQNILIGTNIAAWTPSTWGSNNVVIGSYAAVNGGLDNTLIIDSSTPRGTNPGLVTPLILGNFVNKTLQFDSSLKVLRLTNAIGDSSFTKDVVAKPDGTIGLDDRLIQTIPTITSVFGDTTSVRVVKTGKEVTLNFNKYITSTELTTALGSNSFITICTLPVGYRPLYGEIRLGILTYSGFRLARIFSSGEVLFYPSLKEDGSTTTQSGEGQYNLNISYQVA